MNLSPQRIRAAYEQVRRDLFAERLDAGHWEGELASSALSTATAISALALVQRKLAQSDVGLDDPPPHVRPLIEAGLHWLAARQNPDGGWGDTDKSLSNIATTMLVDAAFRLAGADGNHTEMLSRARQYINGKGGIPGLRQRYGKDKTFAVPILTNCALAGQVRWSEVPPLPFEMAVFPQKMMGALNLPVVSYALPALIAIGLVRYHHAKPRNPLMRMARAAAVEKSLAVLTRIQPESGGFLEATPLTSFVTMSLAGCGRARHPVAKKGVEFLIESARSDGSWPIDTNLATWVTTLSINAQAAAGEPVHELGCLDWLLACQHREEHPYTGAAPGGWAWTDLSGGVPDADDTSGALLALAHWRESAAADEMPDDERIREAAGWGASWLLNLQNRDGGWPTFCRGWGALPFDRSSTDITAHAIRGLTAWSGKLASGAALTPAVKRYHERFVSRISAAVQRGFAYLDRQQRSDGSWAPLWFGNQFHPEEENPIYGTSRVLLAYAALQREQSEPARRGGGYLIASQNRDGGWGGGPGLDSHDASVRSSVEETALAVEALLAFDADAEAAVVRGMQWLLEAVEAGRHRVCSPIGFYFAKLWYYEKLYPLIFVASALGRAVRRWPAHPQSQRSPQPAHTILS